MSNDLVKRARGWNFCWPSHDVEMLVPAMADRIEELEGKLVWAMEYVADYSSDLHLVEWANVNLAKLKGQDDE